MMTQNPNRSQSDIANFRQALEAIAANHSREIQGYIATLCLQYNDPAEFWASTVTSGFVDPTQTRLQTMDDHEFGWHFCDEIEALTPPILGQKGVAIEFAHYFAFVITVKALKTRLEQELNEQKPS